MVKFKELIHSFETYREWESIIKDSFERQSSTYSYFSITKLKVSIDAETFEYPTKIILHNGYLKRTKKNTTNESFRVNNKAIKISESKQIVGLDSYERKGKYSGDIYEILKDIIGRAAKAEIKFSNNLLQTGDNPLYAIDSKQEWPSYLLIINKNKEAPHSENPNNNNEILNELLSDYGINYAYDDYLKNYIIVVFPIPYIKILENRINRNDGQEKIEMVLEFNQNNFLFSSNMKLEIKSLIKGVKDELIYEGTDIIKYGKSRFQVVEINPGKSCEIVFAAFSITLNGTLVNSFSGYYIRQIKLNVNVKSE